MQFFKTLWSDISHAPTAGKLLVIIVGLPTLAAIVTFGIQVISSFI